VHVPFLTRSTCCNVCKAREANVHVRARQGRQGMRPRHVTSGSESCQTAADNRPRIDRDE
jgi:hypothetical protein